MTDVVGGRRSDGASALLVLAMLADARLPTGAHAHSAGLEPAVQAGLLTPAPPLTGGRGTGHPATRTPPATGASTAPRGGGGRGGEDVARVPALAATRLRTVTATEAGAAVVARHLWLDRRDLAPVEHAWAARTPSPAVRDAARRLGRGYLRLALALWPDDLDGAFPAGSAPPRPLVAGAIGAVTGLDALQVALLVGYDDVQTIASAALKLTPLDPATTTRWVLDLHPAVAAMAADVAHLTDPDDIPSAGAPMTDAWAQTHARTTRRLFHG
ncbi:Urease accessory protein UreF-like protein [Cellulomonas sp. Sa3CUA2]|uniref:Urease accessory protein UreF n=1 Tax=Cellulomonas avistercoris TaxID=2762242 RepID=A0ABR8QA30_9CELL|nr:urease accessory UreF family protein [Cellulomonas avistercoris]MBD7917277.1 Urease accessory protein UreF-like protein [Cellulomonas avistercoris]